MSTTGQDRFHYDSTNGKLEVTACPVCEATACPVCEATERSAQPAQPACAACPQCYDPPPGWTTMRPGWTITARVDYHTLGCPYNDNLACGSSGAQYAMRTRKWPLTGVLTCKVRTKGHLSVAGMCASCGGTELLWCLTNRTDDLLFRSSA